MSPRPVVGVVRTSFNVKNVPGGSTWLKETFLRSFLLHPFARGST
jgi:hypothetical protein